MINSRGGRAPMLAAIAAMTVSLTSVVGAASAAVDNHLTLISAGADGAQPDGGSIAPAVSADGRYVAFFSGATNLGPVVEPGYEANVYLRDNESGEIALVSHQGDGSGNGRAVPLVSISADGRYVVYPQRVGLNTVGMRLVMWDRDTDTTTRISKTPAGDDLKAPAIESAISADGGTVVYQIQLAQRVVGDDLTHTRLYVYDVASDTTTQVGGDIVYPTFNTSGHPAVSAEGTFVSYTRSGPENDGLRRTIISRYNTDTGAVSVLWRSAPNVDSSARDVSLSATGRYLAFTHVPPGPNQFSLVSVVDARTKQVELVSRTAAGERPVGSSGDPDISADGRYVVFSSTARDLVDEPPPVTRALGAYRYDRAAGITQRLDVNRQGVYPRGDARTVRISDDGMSVVFSTDAKNLSVGANTQLARVYLWALPVA